jgi:catechol 2,3-dioxygenase-like lactoylglutathione lyase family enzyme
MFSTDKAFSGFSVGDAHAALAFYRDTLGLKVEEIGNGFFNLLLGPDSHVLVYPKPDHEPATFTILNFPVDDVEAAVGELNERGIVTKIYDDFTDEKGIMRGRGPDIAWFRDPAGNVLSVLKAD